MNYLPTFDAFADRLTPYYDKDGITIYNEKAEDVVPAIDPSVVALVLTDPPYGIGLQPRWSSWSGGGRDYPAVHADDRPFDPKMLLAFNRVCLWGANHFSDKLPPGNWLFWRKVDSSPLMAAGELAWHNCGGRPLDYYESTINLARRTDGALHPTQKPVSLMHWCLDRFGIRPGDLVLDPYMGSGPLAQACREIGARYIGIEVVDDYCRVAVNRLKQGVLPLEPSDAFGEPA